MVSFQCDACTDVVKKPKLDRHHGQCRASFTCIDCSATFADPSQWKGHTSCITEAEKYQKSLYRGPKGQDSRPSNGNYKNTQPEITKIPGANGTPLGSPPRMSPVDSSAIDSSVNAAKTEREIDKKRDSEVLVEANTSNAAQPKSKKKKGQDVPEKAEVATDEKKVGVAPELPQEPPSVVNGSTERHRKGKKSKDGFKSETQTSPNELAHEKDRDEKKSKKRKRKVGDGDGRKHKEKRDDGSPSKQSDVVEGQAELVATDAGEVKERAKKRKKSKDKKGGAGEKAPVSDEVAVVEKPKKKRKKSELAQG